MYYSDNPISITTYIPSGSLSGAPSVVPSTLPNSNPSTDPSQTRINKPSNLPYAVPSVEHCDYPIYKPSYVPSSSTFISPIVMTIKLVMYFNIHSVWIHPELQVLCQKDSQLNSSLDLSHKHLKDASIQRSINMVREDAHKPMAILKISSMKGTR